ncbi:MAG: hypothetical protein Q9182_003687 [Xanthomendoza sp. 2 TL-2023]
MAANPKIPIPSSGLPTIQSSKRTATAQGHTTPQKKSKVDEPLEKPVAFLEPNTLSLSRAKFSNELVTIEVRSQKRPFVVHKGLICSKSSHFKAAFTGLSKEAATQPIHLYEDSHEAFDIFHNWLYTRQVTATEGGKDYHPNARLCLDVYVLGDKYDVPELCNAAINSLSAAIAGSGQIIASFVLSVYERTQAKSPMHAFLVAILMQNHQHSVHEITIRNADPFREWPELLMDLIKVFDIVVGRVAMAGELLKSPLSLCAYHRHTGSDRCLYTGKLQAFTAVKMVTDQALENT